MHTLTSDDRLAVEFALLTEGSELKPGEVFIRVAGDRDAAPPPSAGQDDLDETMKLLKQLHRGQHFIEQWTRKNHGTLLLEGDDHTALKVSRAANIVTLRDGYYAETSLTLSIGVGQTIVEADRALTVAQFRGRNRIVLYNLNEVEADFTRASLEVTKPMGESEAAPEAKENEEMVDGFELTALDLHHMKALTRGEEVNPQDLAWLKECAVVETDASGKPALTTLGKEIIGV